MGVATAYLLLMQIQGVGRSLEYSPEQARNLIEVRNQSVRSFDVELSCEIVQCFTTDVPEEYVPGSIKSTPAYTPLDPADVIHGEACFRQMFLNNSNDVRPLRRIESYVDGKLQQRFAFDGSIRRSFQPAHETGLIGGPPDDYGVYAGIGKDYLEMIGFSYRGRPIVGYFRSPAVKVFNDHSQLLVEVFDGPESRNVPMNGYRIWLDPAHGMCPTGFQHYQVIPKFYDSKDIGGDDLEHVTYSCTATDFLQLDDGTWVPVRALITQSMIDWPREDGGLREVKLYDITAVVDVAKSRWNEGVSEEDFVFDFPPATRVYNELLGVHFVASKEGAGSNIDDLLEHAASVIPAGGSAAPVADRSGTMFALMLVSGTMLFVIVIALIVRHVRRQT